MFFRRLSVFSGGWTFEAAESVGGSLDAFTLLPQLIAKSLVLRDVDAPVGQGANDGEATEPRYHYLETVRQYARDRLVESGEVEESRDRHFAYYEALGEAVNFGIGPGAAKFKLDWSIQEHDNLRAAVEWGTSRYPERVINLLWNLAILIADQIPISELIDWSTAAMQQHEDLSAAGETGKQYEQTRNKALVLISMLKLFQGQVDQAKSLAGEAIDLLQQGNGDPFLLIMARFVKGQAGYFLEDVDLEQLIADNIADLQSLQGHPLERPMRAMVTMLSAEIAASEGKLELAEQRLAEGLALLDQTSGLFLTWAELNRMLMLKSIDMPGDELRRHYESGIKALRDNHSRRLAAMVESDWAHRLRHLGSFEEALAIYRRMLVEWQELGHHAAMANILENIAFIDRKQNRPQRAVKLLGAAGRIREEIKQGMLRPEQIEFDWELAALKEKLSEQDMETLWAQGRSLATNDLIALASEKE
jgi:tetratricopeptide (TPR) repeat protein